MTEHSLKASKKSFPQSGRGFRGGLFIFIWGALILWFLALSHEPNYPLTFVREAQSKATVAVLSESLHRLSQWPKWHHSLTEARLHDLRGLNYSEKDQLAVSGGLLTLVIDPRGQKWKRFTLECLITDYQPGKSITVKLVRDSSGKITRLFNSLEWKIELTAEGDHTLIRGTVIGQTLNWRSRFFGRIASRTLMNQVFYANIQALSELSLPVPVNPYQQFEQ